MTTTEQEVMTPSEVADLLRIDRSTLNRMIHAGKGPRFFRVSEHTVRYHRDAVLAYMKGDN